MSSIARFLQIVAIVAFPANTGLALQIGNTASRHHLRSTVDAVVAKERLFAPTKLQRQGSARGAEKFVNGPQRIYREVYDMVSGVTEWTKHTASHGKDILVGRTRAGTVVRVVCVVEGACLLHSPLRTLEVQYELLKTVVPPVAGLLSSIVSKAATLAGSAIAGGASLARDFALNHPLIAASVASHGATFGAGWVAKAHNDEVVKNNLLKKRAAERHDSAAVRIRQAAPERARQAAHRRAAVSPIPAGW